MFPAFRSHALPTILRIWQETNRVTFGKSFIVRYHTNVYCSEPSSVPSYIDKDMILINRLTIDHIQIKKVMRNCLNIKWIYNSHSFSDISLSSPNMRHKYMSHLFKCDTHPNEQICLFPRRLVVSVWKHNTRDWKMRCLKTHLKHRGSRILFSHM